MPESNLLCLVKRKFIFIALNRDDYFFIGVIEVER
jgi:hypothetical protein